MPRTTPQTNNEIEPPFVPVRMDLTAALRRTSEQVETELADQAASRERLENRLPNSAAQANHAYGLGRIESARAHLVDIERKCAQTHDEDFRNDLDDLRDTYLAQIAEGYALTGDYARAAEIHPDTDQAEQYALRLGALESIGSGECRCPMLQIPNGRDAKGTLVKPQRAIEQVWIGEKQGEITFFECETCERFYAVRSGS